MDKSGNRKRDAGKSVSETIYAAYACGESTSARMVLERVCFFFSSRRRHTRLQGDWSSDVCSSDLLGAPVALEFKAAPELPSVNGDFGMMEQILLNLAVNARDAMPRDGRLTITTAARKIAETEIQRNPEARAGWFVCLSVADTGTGIAPEILSRIFEPFFTTKEAGQGTGLGLATVYGIVKQHQGWIEVESQVGRGTTFNVFLPANSQTVASPTP